MLLLATAAFFRLGQPWWLFLLLLLAPDLSLLGLLAGPRAGALIYNAVHTTVSYTHLDVYKRQAWGRSTRSSWAG